MSCNMPLPRLQDTLRIMKLFQKQNKKAASEDAASHKRMGREMGLEPTATWATTMCSAN